MITNADGGDIFPTGCTIRDASAAGLDLAGDCIPISLHVFPFPTMTCGSELQAGVEQNVVSCVQMRR